MNIDIDSIFTFLENITGCEPGTLAIILVIVITAVIGVFIWGVVAIIRSVLETIREGLRGSSCIGSALLNTIASLWKDTAKIIVAYLKRPYKREQPNEPQSSQTTINPCKQRHHSLSDNLQIYS